MYAYNELKKQLENIDEFRFIFTYPTFIAEKAEKQKREFYIPRLNREHSLYGTEFELKLRNEMTQRAVARECAEWIRKKATFKSNTTGNNMGGFATVESVQENVAYMPLNGFTTVDIGCERGNNSYNMVNRMETPFSEQYMQLLKLSGMIKLSCRMLQMLLLRISVLFIMKIHRINLLHDTFIMCSVNFGKIFLKTYCQMKQLDLSPVKYGICCMISRKMLSLPLSIS